MSTFYTQTAYLEKGLKSFSDYVAPLTEISSVFYDENIVGNTVTVPLITAGTGSAFSGSYTVANTVVSNIDVPLTHAFYAFDITVTDANKNASAKLETLYDSALKAFGATVAKYALGDVSSFTVSSSFANPGAFGWAGVKTMASQLDTANAPIEDRSLVIRSDYFGSLRPDPTATIRMEPKDYNFNGSYMVGTNVLPSGVKGLALSKGTYGVASALTNNPLIGKNVIEESTVITDEGTGLAFRFFVYGNPDSGQLKGVFETRIGGKIAIPGGSVKIV